MKKLGRNGKSMNGDSAGRWGSGDLLLEKPVSVAVKELKLEAFKLSRAGVGTQCWW